MKLNLKSLFFSCAESSLASTSSNSSSISSSSAPPASSISKYSLFCSSISEISTDLTLGLNTSKLFKYKNVKIAIAANERLKFNAGFDSKNTDLI